MPVETARIGIRLKAARERLGWNRETLAFHSGISWSAIAQVESGRRTNLRPSTLSALAGALGVTIDYLVTGGASNSRMLHHCAVLYGSDPAFLEAAVPFVTEAIERSEPTLIVTSASNIDLLREQLGAGARQLDFAERSSWYDSPLQALNGYREFVDAKLALGAPWVRILGEPLWSGRTGSEARLWTVYESMLNLVFSAQPASVHCLYDTRVVEPEIVGHARATHPHTAERGILAPSPEYADPGEFVLGG